MKQDLPACYWCIAPFWNTDFSKQIPMLRGNYWIISIHKQNYTFSLMSEVFNSKTTTLAAIFMALVCNIPNFMSRTKTENYHLILVLVKYPVEHLSVLRLLAFVEEKNHVSLHNSDCLLFWNLTSLPNWFSMWCIEYILIAILNRSQIWVNSPSLEIWLQRWINCNDGGVGNKHGLRRWILLTAAGEPRFDCCAGPETAAWEQWRRRGINDSGVGMSKLMRLTAAWD